MQAQFSANGKNYTLTLDRDGDRLRAMLDGQTHAVEVLDEQPGQLTLRLDGRRVTLYWAVDGPDTWVSMGGCTFRLGRPIPRSQRRPADHDGGENVRAPMPALVRAVLVQPGDTVEKGQTLLLLEAMKMEIRVKSPLNSRITRLLAAENQTVDRDQPLVEIEGVME